jgi:hypothetical protein
LHEPVKIHWMGRKTRLPATPAVWTIFAGNWSKPDSPWRSHLVSFSLGTARARSQVVEAPVVPGFCLAQARASGPKNAMKGWRRAAWQASLSIAGKQCGAAFYSAPRLSVLFCRARRHPEAAAMKLLLSVKMDARRSGGVNDPFSTL